MVATEIQEEIQCRIAAKISVISCVEEDEEEFAKHESNSGFEITRAAVVMKLQLRSVVNQQ